MLLAMLPWSALTISQQVTGNAVVFSLRKFVENPALLAFVLSVPSFVSLVTVTLVNFLSDRIWTPFGRRKPFIMIGFTGMAICLFLMPLMPTFWSLVAVFIIMNLCMDLDSPVEPLKQEIVPPAQRGTATGVMSWINQAAQLAFMFFVFGRFDDVHFMAGIPITGETAIYWCAGLIALSSLMLLALGIKETYQPSALKGQRLSIKTFIGGLTDRELLPVYILIVGAAVMQAGTGPLGALLYTEQWGYTKQDMGTNIAIGGTINLFLIAILTLMADRLNRLRAYQTLILVSIALNIAYYCYVHFILPDRRPALFEIVLFGEMMSVTGILTGLVYTPLIYDYVVRNKMGTYVAGAQLVNRLTNVLAVNGAGLFVIGYAAIFQPPAGEMVRVVLKEPTTAASIKERLVNSNILKAGGSTGDLYVSVWNADGMVADSGLGMEIRLRNPDSERIASEVKSISESLKARQNISPKGDLESTSLKEKRANLEKTLHDRSLSFEQNVKAVLNDYLTTSDGGSVPPRSLEACVISYNSEGVSERILNDFLASARKQFPELIDIVESPDRRSIEISFLDSGDNGAFQTRLQAFSDTWRNGIFRLDGSNSSRRSAAASEWIIPTVEQPIPSRTSPIMGFLQHVAAWFGFETPRDIRPLAVGRTLRDVTTTPHVGAYAQTNDGHSVRIVAVFDPANIDDARSSFRDRVIQALAGQRLTAVQPVLTSTYVPVRYDYMAGNLLSIILGFVGFGITMIFYRLNKKGIIRRRGAEEAAFNK